MKTILVLLACVLMTPFAFGQTTRARVPSSDTPDTNAPSDMANSNTTHVMAVNAFAPGDKIVVQTPTTQPMTISLNGADVSYVTADGRPISPSSIRPGSHVRLEFTGTGDSKALSRIVLVSAS